MSTPAPAVVVPTQAGIPQPGQAAAVTPMKGGGIALTPLPLTGGRRRGGKTRRLSKKVLRMFKTGSKAKLAKLMKGGEDEVAEGTETTEEVGGRRRKTKKGGRKSSRSSRSSRRMYRGFF